MILGIYRHYKGGHYLVLKDNIQNASKENDEFAYLYISLYRTKKYKRFKMWYKSDYDFESTTIEHVEKRAIYINKYQRLSKKEALMYILKGGWLFDVR